MKTNTGTPIEALDLPPEFDTLAPDRRVAALLRAARQATGASILKFSHRVGYHENTIQRWERGGVYTIAGFVAWCDALHVRPSDVLRRCGL